MRNGEKTLHIPNQATSGKLARGQRVYLQRADIKQPHTVQHDQKPQLEHIVVTWVAHIIIMYSILRAK